MTQDAADLWLFRVFCFGYVMICTMCPLPVLPIRNDVRKVGNKLRQRRRGNLLARLELEARTGTSPQQDRDGSP